MKGRVGATVAVALAMVAGLGAPAAAPTDDDQTVGTLGTSMVEMLGQETGSNPVTLSTLRNDVFAWDNGYLGDGSGVDVALIDTGVAPVNGLDGADKVLHGPDLSFEGSSPQAAYLDTYGHGTHMAGIIAGERAGNEGIAPGARIVSIKTAGHDGITTVPQVVAAIDWAIEHRNTDGLNIRVINLSLGQAGVTSHVGDYLSAAVERAWNAGIVVVVAAGNDGDSRNRLDSPAIDPYVVAVGAVDSSLKPYDKSGREVPDWSGTGSGSRYADIVAQGRSIASYRVPGSTIDQVAPNARYHNDLFLGSGTSQSAAVTSGVVAALLSVQPNLDPDDVKAALETQAFDLWRETAEREGSGHLNGSGTVGNGAWINVAAQSFPNAAGPGTGIATPNGSTWSGGTWSGSTWSGSTWSGSTWSGGTWSGSTWSGSTWSGSTWSGSTWSGGTWSGSTWSGGTWSGGTWSGNGWS